MAFVTSLPQARSGVYAAKVPAPAVIPATGTGVSVIVGGFGWGPPNVETYPSTLQQFAQVYAPAGSNRLNSAYLSILRKQWPVLGAVRAEKSSSVAATATINKTGPAACLVITAAYPGVTGNSLVATIGAAGDGNANHFRLTVTLTGASGTTTEVYDNLNVSGTGADVLPPSLPGLGGVNVIAQPGSTGAGTSVLIGSVTKSSAGSPLTGSTTLSGGTDVALTANEYVGTPGNNDFGFALLEGDRNVNNVFCDDMGSSLRTAVNTGLLAHLALMTDRLGFFNGPAGQTSASAQTDVANYRSPYACYVDPWASIFDDVTGNLQSGPSAAWAASVRANMPASASIAWRDQAGPLLAGIAMLEANRGSATGANTAAGITTLVPRPAGGWMFDQDVNTSAVAGQTDLFASAMDLFLSRSVASAWEPWVNAPNLPFFQQDLINSLDAFLAILVANGNTNPAALPFIKAYQAPSVKNVGIGICSISSQVQYADSMRNILFQLQSGVGITVQSS